MSCNKQYTDKSELRQKSLDLRLNNHQRDPNSHTVGVAISLTLDKIFPTTA